MRHDEATLRQFWSSRQFPARFPVARQPAAQQQPAPAAPVAAQQPAPPQQLAAQQAFNASLQRRSQAEAQRAAVQQAAAPQAAAQQAAHTAAAQPRAQKVGGGAPAIDVAKVPAMTVKALKEELGGRGLAVGGKKGELVTRLTEALDAAAANPISAVLRASGTPG